jgi:hypothetical protein
MWIDMMTLILTFRSVANVPKKSMQHNDHNYMSQPVRPSSGKLSYWWCTYMVFSYPSPTIVLWE